MKISKENKYLLTITILFCSFYTLMISPVKEDRLSMGFIVLFIPALTIFILLMENSKLKKVLLSILLVLTALFIIVVVYLIAISGNFYPINGDRFNFSMFLQVCLFTSPILICYILLLRSIFKEIVSI